MASEREIERVRRDATVWRPLVSRLLTHGETLFEFKDFSFLESLSRRPWLEELSIRQACWLLDIRDTAQFVASHRGFSVRALLARCHERRADYDDEDAQLWLSTLQARWPERVRLRDARRLFNIAKALSLVDDWAV